MPAQAVHLDADVLRHRPQRRRVQPGHVIALKEGVHHQLPIAGHVVAVVVVDVHVAKAHGGQVADQLVGQVGKIGLGLVVQNRPDDAALLHAGQLGQAELALVDLTEGLLARDRRQLAGKVVAPGVIGADEQLGRLHLLVAHQPRAAVAADVHQGVDLAGLVAGQDDRQAVVVAADVGSGLRQPGGRRQRHRQALEQPFLLQRIAGVVDIFAGRHGHVQGRPVRLGVVRKRPGGLQLAGGWRPDMDAGVVGHPGSP